MERGVIGLPLETVALLGEVMWLPVVGAPHTTFSVIPSAIVEVRGMAVVVGARIAADIDGRRRCQMGVRSRLART
jgi:hypothetical protein